MEDIGEGEGKLRLKGTVTDFDTFPDVSTTTKSFASPAAPHATLFEVT
jgi:hypothetical protein